MKKALLGTTALVMGLGLLNGAALAQVVGNADVKAVIAFDKTVNVVENIGREKAVFLNASPMIMPVGAAEAAAIAVVGHSSAFYSATGATGSTSVRLDLNLVNAIYNNSGVVGVNQDMGSMNNQGNLVSFGSTNSETALADSQAETEQYNVNSVVNEQGSTTTANASTTDGKAPGGVVFRSRRTTTLQDAVYQQTGITGVNQTSGTANNQTNSISLAVGLNGTAALSEAALGQTTASNIVQSTAMQHTALVTNAVNNNQGMTHVNQTSGNLNSQSSTIAWSGTVGSNQAAPGVLGNRF